MPDEPVRWLGLVLAGGVLLPGLMWVVLADSLSTRWRDVLAIAGVLMLAASATGALARTAVAGLVIGSERTAGRFLDGDTDRGLDLLLTAVGVAVGLGVALFLLRAPGPLDGEPATPERTGEGAGHLLPLVALGLALPLAPVTTFASQSYRAVTATTLLAVAVSGVLIGLGLVAAAVPGDRRDGVLPAFLLVAAGSAVVFAWPETFEQEQWLFLGSALAAGLLVPALVRVARVAVADDPVAVVGGALLAIVLVVGATALAARGRDDSLRKAQKGFSDTCDEVSPGVCRTGSLGRAPVVIAPRAP